MREESDWQQRLALIERFVAESLKHVGEGAEVDLSGLDEQIDKVTSELKRLPPEEVLGARERLQLLMDQMQQLGDRLQPVVYQQIKGLNLQKKANMAYRKTDNMPKPEKKAQPEKKD